MMGGGEARASSFGDSGSLGRSSNSSGGAGDQSGSNLARDAGVNDLGSQRHGNQSQTGSRDQDHDHDQDDIDSEDFDDFDDFDEGEDT